MSLFLSRLRLSRAPSTRALDALLNPAGEGPRIDAHHRLLWAAFADGPGRTRDFLWRDEGAGVFLTLSTRPPAPSELFEPPEVKPFAPQLSAGDQLAFSLRANATRARKGVGRVDVVMDALHAVERKDGVLVGIRQQAGLGSDKGGQRTEVPSLAIHHEHAVAMAFHATIIHMVYEIRYAGYRYGNLNAFVESSCKPRVSSTTTASGNSDPSSIYVGKF